MRVGAFIQARMSSSRFPGKVLAPLDGRPLILHVVERARAGLGDDDVVVLTSDVESDDPLVSYLGGKKIPVFRGPLDDVTARFRQAVASTGFDWFFRISGDSPLLRPDIMSSMRCHAGSTGIDLVSNVAVRTFPRGHSVELIRSDTFLAVDHAKLSASDREHVTPTFYRNAHRYGIISYEMDGERYGCEGYAVDTVADLERIEQLLSGNPTVEFPPYVVRALSTRAGV